MTGDALLTAVARAAELRDDELDASTRRDRGVVHTPPALASAMLVQLDVLFAAHGLPALRDRRAVDVLDPAMGPGVFLAATLAHLGASSEGRCARLFGIDVDPAAAERTRRLLVAAAEGRAELALDVRDALAAPWTATAEASDAPERPLVVVGNPPWSARGRGPDYVESLVARFHVDEHGAPLRERRRGVLADAYVRFLAWSIDAIERTPAGGALALVTNASYLDGPVHRGVRAALLASFDALAVVDLGGSALVARSGARDPNVFGVRPGAAILIAVRSRDARSRALPTFRRARGTVEAKLAAVASPEALAIEPVERPLDTLRPSKSAGRDYARWPSLAEWFVQHGEGVQTNRDAWVVAETDAELLARLERMADGHDLPPARPHFDPEAARRVLVELRARGELAAWIEPLAYRPFERRAFFAHPALCHRARPELLAVLGRAAVRPRALVSVRQDRGELPWSHAALVEAPIDNCFLSARSSCRARAFPARQQDGTSNLAPAITQALVERGLDPDPHRALAYVAAWLTSRAYTERFASELALDYPRVPLPESAVELERFVAEGERLAQALRGEASRIRGRATREPGMVVLGHHTFAPTGGAAALEAVRATLGGLVDEALASRRR